MTLAWQAARILAVVAVVTFMATLLPLPSSTDTADLTIPDVIWNPIVGVLALNRYFPIATLLILASTTLLIRAALAGFWIVSWLLRHVLG